MIDKKRELKSIMGFSVGPIVSAAVGFLVTPIITYYISPDEYAKLNMYLLFQNLLSVSVYLALDQAFIRFFNERIDKRRLWRQTIVIPLIIACIIAFVVLGNYKFFSDYLFDIQENYLPIVLFCISIPLVVVERFILIWLRMQEKSLEYSFFSILLKVSVLSVTVLFMMLYEKSYLSAIYGYVLGQMLVDIILMIKNWRLLGCEKRTFVPKEMKELICYAMPLAPADIISLLLNSMDRIMLERLGTMTDVGLYGVSLKVTGLLLILKTCVSLFWTPMSLRWKVNGVDNLQFSKMMDIFVFIFSLVTYMCLFVKPIIFMIFGREYIDAKYSFPYLLFYPILYTMCELFIVGILFQKKGHVITLCNLLSLIINIGLNWKLIPILGGVGAALATAVCNGIYFFTIMAYSRKVWFRFPCVRIIISVICMYIIASINVFVRNEELLIYVNMIAIALTCVMYKNVVCDALKVIRKK